MKAQRPKGCIGIKEAARYLEKRGYDTDMRRFGAQLRALGLLEGRCATDKAIKEGLLEETQGVFIHGAGGSDYYTRPWITSYGLAFLFDNIKKCWQPDGDVELGITQCKLGF